MAVFLVAAFLFLEVVVSFSWKSATVGNLLESSQVFFSHVCGYLSSQEYTRAAQSPYPTVCFTTSGCTMAIYFPLLSFSKHAWEASCVLGNSQVNIGIDPWAREPSKQIASLLCR